MPFSEQSESAGSQIYTSILSPNAEDSVVLCNGMLSEIAKSVFYNEPYLPEFASPINCADVCFYGKFVIAPSLPHRNLVVIRLSYL